MKKLWFTVPLFAVIFTVSCLMPTSVSVNGKYGYHFGIPDFLVVIKTQKLENANIFNALYKNSGVEINAALFIAAIALAFLFAVLIDDLLIARGKELRRKYRQSHLKK